MRGVVEWGGGVEHVPARKLGSGALGSDASFCAHRWCGRAAAWWWSCSHPWLRVASSSATTTGLTAAPTSTTSMRYETVGFTALGGQGTE